MCTKKIQLTSGWRRLVHRNNTNANTYAFASTTATLPSAEASTAQSHIEVLMCKVSVSSISRLTFCHPLRSHRACWPPLGIVQVPDIENLFANFQNLSKCCKAANKPVRLPKGWLKVGVGRRWTTNNFKNTNKSTGPHAAKASAEGHVAATDTNAEYVANHVVTVNTPLPSRLQLDYFGARRCYLVP